MNDPTFGAGFPRHTYEDWRDLAVATLKGGDFERRLVTKTYDGIAIEPLYTAGHAKDVSVPVTDAGPWRIAQRITHHDPRRAAELVRDEIAGGAETVVLRIASPERPRGIAVASPSDLDPVLDALDVGVHGLRIEAGSLGPGMAAILTAHLARRGIDPSHSRCCPGIDPYAAALDGADGAAHPDAVIAAAAGALDAGFTAPVFTVDAHRLHAAGASEAQEIAGALAMGVHLLRRLEAAGIDPEAASAAIGFVFAADADIFLTMAKLRAWPVVWKRVLEACGVAAQPARPAATTASRMLSARDPAVNMLRATAAVFAAAVAGAGEITVAPYTDALGEPDGLARRIARNTQIILREESGIARVADPAAGSWYVDTVTEALAEAAWVAFQTMEAMGGFVAALEAGHVQSTICGVAEQRRHDIATRKLGLTGVSEYANVDEKPASVDAAAPSDGATSQTTAVSDWSGAIDAVAKGTVPVADGARAACVPLPRITLAEPFEALRALSDRVLADTGARPRVFLATLGRPADHAARVGWTRTVFEAGGFEPVQGAASAFAQSGASIACLCGSDADYEASATEAIAALEAAGAAHVFVAGRANEALQAAGAGTFVHMGADIVAILEAAHRYSASGQGS